MGAVSNRGLTSGYQNEANNAKLSVRIWNSITVISMILLIVFTIYSFIHFESNRSFNWSAIITRFGVVAAFIGLASYSGL
ncbi:hypothetical protein [Bacillus sp. AFS096315]|uniref:hypothetical protein n=1 Tax=Bacillus sp. AFS096315 TaxID=2033517 RepID=UPI000BEBA231|nr:hypothetical protein [Bacillus sp. AFS096315]PEC50300.1 hypothetical protein CON00_07050 [Bacillus sp. AFS096315]